MLRELGKIFINLVILQTICVYNVKTARILISFPPPIRSHFFLGKALAQELAKRGHEVTFINPFGMTTPVAGVEEIVLTQFEDMKKDRHNVVSSHYGKLIINQFIQILKRAYTMSEYALNDTKIQELISVKNRRYDLLILGAIFNEAHAGLADFFNCPLIIVSTTGSNMPVNHYVSNLAPPSYVPQWLTPYTGVMTFWQRMHNTINTLMMDIVFFGYYLPSQDVLLHKYFPSAPPLSEILRQRTALALLNSHTSISPAKPMVPNMIEIGGYHVQKAKPLPKQLKDYLDEAKEGFILFSMGSNIRTAMFPNETLENILQVFSELPYKILWKFEDDQLRGQPSNVKIEKWLPQNDILVHPNLKLFITHGGMLSTTEAVYHGVPIVGIPVFGDQEMNMASAESLGIGRAVLFKELNYERLRDAIHEVIHDKRYKESAKRRSKLLRDQPLQPMDKAIFWIEYVLRNKNCDHLHTGAVHLTWYQKMYLDIIILLSFPICGTILVAKWGLKKWFYSVLETIRRNKKIKTQ